LERRENGQLWNGYTSDEVPQGEQSVWILKKKKKTVSMLFFFLVWCLVKSLTDFCPSNRQKMTSTRHAYAAAPERSCISRANPLDG